MNSSHNSLKITGIVAWWLIHLDNEGTVLSVDLTAKESGAWATKTPILTLGPATEIEGVEVILPSKIKSARSLVICLHFDVVVSHIERHASFAEVVTPSCEGRCPEVHHQVLRFVGKCHICLVLWAAHLVTIDEPLDVVWRPLDNVIIPVRSWSEARAVRLVLLLPLPDDIHTHWVLHGWNKLDIDFIPAFLWPAWPLPVGEERTDGAFLVRTLHTEAITTIGESLRTSDLSTNIVCLSQACKHKGSC